jgi:methyltransferase
MTTFWFVLLILLLAGQRLYELRLSRRNSEELLARGATEAGARHMPVMKALHTLWFLAMLVEVFAFQRPFLPVLAVVGVAGLVAGQMLRYAAIRRLGPRWSVRVLVLPGSAPVTGGIYRYVRHPNYLGVMLEIAAVPLIHSAYLTAITFTILNGALLYVRIRAEERALREANDYDAAFGDTARFIPGRGETAG